MPILDIKSTQEAIKNPTLAMVIEEGFKITDANNELISNAYDIVKNDATQSANSAKVAEQKANEANAHALASAESARQANISADNAITIATDAEATANGIDAKATQALTNSEQAQAGVIRLDGKTDATNDRVGKLEVSEGQQEAKISTLQRDLNNVKAEYLDKYNLTETQLVRSLTDFEKSPLVPTIKSSDINKDDGRRTINYATMKRDAMMLYGDQVASGNKNFLNKVTANINPLGVIETYKHLTNLECIAQILANSTPEGYYKGKQNINFPGGSMVIGFDAMNGCKFNVTDVRSSAYYVAIGGLARTNMTSLTFTTISACVLNYKSVNTNSDLKTVTFEVLTLIDAECFLNCTQLNRIVIKKGSEVANLRNISAFNNTGITPTSGEIYVPDALIEKYKKATNWIVFASQIKPISELPPEEATV